uniref:Pentafunctional AROM polypeptide n=1 Tax=Spongospora subterranea TaxID=70186 RepID=A0A0H5RKL3_9EUKA|eukprot:CRZ09274.1 hypothetical protein [Spongospora subterranea]
MMMWSTDLLSYRIHVAPGILLNQNIVSLVTSAIQESNATATPSLVLIVDNAIPRLLPSLIGTLCSLLRTKYTVLLNLLDQEPGGELLKTRKMKACLEDYLLSNSCGRDTVLIGLGGGALGDLVGFVAATFMRGIPYIHIPTTLLSMVDSSIGGKTAINTDFGKNLLGAFYQPIAVFCDLDFLTVLPSRHISNGLAEIIKCGMIADRELFEYCADNAHLITSDRDQEALMHIICSSIAIKARIVSEDSHERGMRAILNFGHSIGHAIERILSPELLHGECVAIGMVYEAMISRSLGFCRSDVILRLCSCLKQYQLPVLMPSSLNHDDILAKMSSDKKNLGLRKRIVLISGVGSVRDDPWTTEVEDDRILIAIGRTISVSPTAQVQGIISVPGSKSISNRVLLLAALSNSKVTISGMLYSEDTEVMIKSLRALGVSINIDGNSNIHVQGNSGKFHAPSEPLFLANAGTASRFLTSVAALLPEGQDCIISGCQRMHDRPINDLVDVLRSCGVEVEYIGLRKDCLPIRVCGGGLKGGNLTLKGSISSQFVSSILMVAPFASNDINLTISGDKVVSRPYIDMTVALMSQFGVQVVCPNLKTFEIKKGQQYKCQDLINVEGDASSASYPLAIAAITRGKVTVSNVGQLSLQGDSQFCQVLQSMGCEVEQSPTTTTVKGPPDGKLLQAVDIDLNSMTDTFMTLAACAAVASGRSFIRNIDNQRVKECNRIQATVSELTKIGIKAGELSDGIWIEGDPLYSGPRAPTAIDCHSDHRIAMMFATLSCRFSNIIISDKNCVGKTYPEFWDDIGTSLHVNMSPAVVPTPSLPTIGCQTPFVLTGMRGCGKSTLGRICSKLLGLRFIDMDAEFVAYTKCSITNYVAEFGWDDFRGVELSLLKDKLRTRNCLIATGGGIVESSEAIALLRSSCSIEIRRDIRDIISKESHLKDRCAPDEPISATWERRRKLYEAASVYEFPISYGDWNWETLSRRLFYLLSRLRSPPISTPLSTSFFVTLTFEDLEEVASVDILRIAEQCDAVEFRVDLLKSYNHDFVRKQWAILRRILGPLPIIFTVRSQSQCGNAPDSPDQLVALLLLGARLAADYVDVESHLSDDHRRQILSIVRSSFCSRIIGSYHSRHNGRGSLSHLFSAAELNGTANIVKVAISATDPLDACRLTLAAETYRKHHPGMPCIALAMGSAGRLSRVMNTFLSPVTHPLLPVAGATGQMTVEEITTLRLSLGLIRPQRFYLFGYPIDRSPSSAMHNAAFTHLRLPHQYSNFSSELISSELRNCIKDHDFGGGSVTIPLKEKIHSLVDRVTDVAKKIGAINTLFRDPENPSALVGDNTDWIGIVRALETVNMELLPETAALVLGAGGTAKAAIFGLCSMGFDSSNVFVYNRTTERARVLSEEFGCCVVSSLDDLPTVNFSVIINTIPWASSFHIPDGHPIFKMSPFAFLDLNYVPGGTRLSRQAAVKGWPVIGGDLVLLYQGIAAFRLWSGYKAPEAIMAKAIASFQEETDEGRQGS